MQYNDQRETFTLCSVPSDESVFSGFREALCSIVFSALSESNSSLQITATSVLTSLAQQTGEM